MSVTTRVTAQAETYARDTLHSIATSTRVAWAMAVRVAACIDPRAHYHGETY